MTLQEKLELLNEFLGNQPQEFASFLLNCYYLVGEEFIELSTRQQLCSYFLELKILYYTKIKASWDLMYLEVYGDNPEFKEFIVNSKKEILRELTTKNYQQVLEEFRNIFNRK